MHKSKSLVTSILLAASFATTTIHAQQLSGAGATFPAPLYQRWSVEFNKANPSIQVNYQSVGSGAGVKNLIKGVVDFAGSDAAMTDEEISKVSRGVVMIPATAGQIVLAYNLPGIPKLNITREAMAGIFLGTVKKWNDPAITTANPGINLPANPIQVAYRSDSSGTTFVFTQHVSAVDSKFADIVGADKSVAFPVGVGGKGNEGVTALIKQSAGTIGYIEYGYAKENGLSMASLQNKAGNFVTPDLESGARTLASVKLPENLRVWPVDPAGANDYPIVTFTWLLLYKSYSDSDKLNSLKKFVTWALSTGQTFSKQLGYIPLPESVVQKSEEALSTVK